MKYCSNCGQSLPDTAEFCNSCGTKCQSTQTNNTVVDNATPAPNSFYQAQPVKTGHNGLTKAAFILLIIIGAGMILDGISTVFIGSMSDYIEVSVGSYVFGMIEIFASSLNFWFARKVDRDAKSGIRFSTGFKVCVLLFGGLIPGILLLCDKEH